jgi:pimeloyl-ACP methyl ester carboxylesterase
LRRLLRGLAITALLLGALAWWGWRSGDEAPIDVVEQARTALGIPLESSLVETNGIRLHVVQAGPVDGPPVVLLHGFPEFWWTWHAQLKALAQAGFRVIVPDQRGFGRSDKPPRIEDYRSQERLADIVGLLDALGHRDVYLAGHDFGGFVAWNLAIRHPERVRKLVVFNVAHPEVYRSPPPPEPGHETTNWFRYFFQLPWLPELALRSGNWYLLGRNLIESSQPGSFAEPALSYYKSAWAYENAMHTMLDWYRATYRYPSAAPADSRVHMPMRLVWGSLDRFNDPLFAAPSLVFCDFGELVRFEDAGHWVLREKEAETSALLIDFFSEP